MPCENELLSFTLLASRYGAATAIKQGETKLTYQDLPGRISEWHHKFESAGIHSQSRIAAVATRNIEGVLMLLAAINYGSLVIPLSSDTPVEKQEEAATDCRADFLLNESGIHRLKNANSFTDPIQGQPRLGLLSSGSTGKPKLVLRSKKQILSALEIYADSVHLGSSDTVLAMVPLDHSYGFNNVLLSTLSVGGCVSLPAQVHPRVIARQIGEEGITLLPGAPSLFDLVTKFCADSQPDFRTLRACISVGTALPFRTYSAFTSAFNVPLWQSYGSSEAGPVCLNRTGSPDGELVALGEVCEGVQVSIEENGRAVEDGETGELSVRSPAVGLGYEGEHDGSSRVENGVFHSGDLVCRQAGLLYFRGRRKLLIAAGGNKIDPVEIEAVLLCHEQVEDAAVVAHRDGVERECVKAIIVARGTLDTLDIMDFCSRRLAPMKVPRLIEFRASLPRNAMGKLQRELL
jgi:long-chain acyl-CoA synthetase